MSFAMMRRALGFVKVCSSAGAFATRYLTA